jgi:hypothetical protein
MSAPHHDHLESSVKLAGANAPEPMVSRHQEEFAHHSAPAAEEQDYRKHGSASVSLADGTQELRMSASRMAYANHGVVETASQSHTTNELLKSHVFVDDKVPLPKSTQQSNYPPPPPTAAASPVVRPRSKLDLGQPHVDLKDTFKSSYQNTHRGEIPKEDSVSPSTPRNTFQSSFQLSGGLPSEPMMSTNKQSFTAPVVSEADQVSAGDITRQSRTSISLADALPPAALSTTASTHFSRPPQEALLNSPSKPTRSMAWDSSVSLGDKETKKMPTPTSRESYPPRPITPTSPSRAPRTRTTGSNSILGKEAVDYRSTNNSSFQRPQTPPEVSNPSRKTGDLQRSSFSLSSNEPHTKMTSTSRSMFSAPPPESSASSPSLTSSPSTRKSRSHFTLGNDAPTYQTTNRSQYTGTASSSSPSSSPNPARHSRSDQISNVTFGDTDKFSMSSHTSSSRSVYQAHSPAAPTRPSNPMKSNFTLG